jgi:hypothetical protein
VGEWDGHYNCGAATNSAFDLTVTQEGGTALSAVLRFDVPARSGQSGRFRLRGNAADAAGRFALSPSERIDKPEGVAPFGLSGQISGNNQVLSGNLLGCGGASFEARRKQPVAPQAAEQDAEAVADVLSPPAPGGPLEGVWRGEMTCQIGDRRLAMPLEILVSHQGLALAAVLTSSLAAQRGIPSSRWRSVYLSRAADGGGPLDQRIDLEGMSRFVRIEAILPDPAAGTLRLQIRNPGCTTNLAKTNEAYPSGFAALSAGLPGTWATPPRETVGANRASAFRQIEDSPVMQQMSTLLTFRREGTLLFGRIRAFAPPYKPPAEQDRLVADLRPLLTTEDGRIGFVVTRRRRAEGVFDPSARWRETFSRGALLLLRPPAAQDSQIEVAVSEYGGLNPPNLLLQRRSEEDAKAVAEGGPPQALAPGFGGRLAAAKSFKAQCDVLAEWGRPLTGRPDALTVPVERLGRETLPLFEDETFVPVFGLPYAMTTAEQRRAVFYLLARDCPQKLKMSELDHYNLTQPWSDRPAVVSAISAGLMERHDAQHRVGDAMARLRELPETLAGMDEFAKIERAMQAPVELLDEAARNAFAKLAGETRLRVANGILRERVAAIGALPDSAASLDVLKLLAADITKSGLPPSEQATAAQAVRDRSIAIAQSMIARMDKAGASAPLSLAGLIDATRAIREIAALAARPDVALGQAGAVQAASAAIARRRDIMADPGVRQAFAEQMLAGANSGKADSVKASAAAFLQPEEMSGPRADPFFSQTIETALNRAEERRFDIILGAGQDSARSEAASGPERTSSGEPTARQMLKAFDEIAGSINTGQGELASRCARGQVRNDPLLAIMCLGQMGAGGPMHVGIASFRKLGCKDADNLLGYYCDYSFRLGLSGARRMGILGEMMESGGTCTGRFVRDGSHWLLQEKECR